MFTKVRSLKVMTFVAVLMLVSTVAVMAAVDCTWQGHQHTISNRPSAGIVSDQLVIYPEASPAYTVTGTLKWYVCPGATITAATCSTLGTNFYNRTLTASDKVMVLKNTDPYTITSGGYAYDLNKTSWYCFRVEYSGNYGSFTDIGGPSNSAECFNVSSSTAVTLSSFGAESNSFDVNNLALPGIAAFAGLLALAGLLGAGYVVRARS